MENHKAEVIFQIDNSKSTHMQTQNYILLLIVSPFHNHQALIVLIHSEKNSDLYVEQEACI